MKKNKSKLKIKKLLIVILVMAAIIFGMYKLVTILTPKDTTKAATVVSEIKAYGYTLDDNETKLYNNLFKSLEKALNASKVDDKDYATLISELFVADFYNLDNKVSNSDIGGVQFIHASAKTNFILNAQDTIYKYVESNLNGNRDQDLPIITAIKVDSVETTTFKYNSKTYDAYEVKITTTYKTNLGYPTSVTLMIIHETTTKLAIVEVN